MTGLDTNILVRYLTQDDPMQSPKARKITAMIALKDGQGSFADAVIAALGARMGCSCTLTFRPEGTASAGFRTSLRTPNPV
jgi:predicted nucleic-acid-binding protein